MQASGARPVLPEVIERHADSEGATLVLHLQIPASLAWFDGHFPDDPILPAVVQIDWVTYFGADLGFDSRRFSGMDRLKFRSVITPETSLILRLEAAGDALHFSYESASGIHSKGAILFHGHDDNPDSGA